MLKNGTVIDGKYEILSKIGQGGMSVVYLAMNKKANKQWAIKEVRKDGIKNYEVVKQGLVTETDILKKLNHPNLPSIIDIIETDGSFLIIMDYIQGKPLSDAIKEFGAQPQEYVIEWAKQLCDVLGYLHTRIPPIIYRDMKPANVMLKPEGTVTLIDFGTAREFKEQNMADTTCLGTQGYAAPEQYGGQGQTDARTDIYCLGTTLYHLVTGHNPCEPPYDIYPIRQWNPNLSGGLEKIIIKCTQRNPSDRYQSCAELLYDLEHFEEIDDAFRKSQRKKFISFIVTASLSVLFFFVSMFGMFAADQERLANYSVKIDDAKKSTDSIAKRKLYIEAIQISPEKKEAYKDLIDEYKYDGVFGEDEVKEFIQEVAIKYYRDTNTKTMDYLKTSKADYADICFDIGNTYLFYSQRDTNPKQTINGYKDSLFWFNEVVKNTQSNPKNKSKAEIYVEIGDFNNKIDNLQKTATDSGEYIKYWTNLKKLKSNNDSNPDSDSITVRLYKEIINKFNEQYAAFYKQDGVSQKELVDMVNDIQSSLTQIKGKTNQEIVKRDIDALLPNCTQAINMINNAYSGGA